MVLPIHDPFLIFAAVLLIIFFTPPLSRRLRIPPIAGLILVGMLMGPHVLRVLERGPSIILFGTVGLLYIMFLSGLEIDMGDVRKLGPKIALFGALSFVIPQALGTAASLWVLNLTPAAAVLLGGVLATHTLLSYPIAARLGIAGHPVVKIAIGGTLICDTAALLILSIVGRSVNGDLNPLFWIRIILSVVTFLAIVIFAFPVIAKWFFRKVESEGHYQYIFILVLVFASGFLAEVAGLEPIIGAFVSGISLKRLIPSSSALMHHIEFIGNALFIPFFLISTGMLVNPRVIFQGSEIWIVSGIVIGIGTAGKWAASWIFSLFTGLSRPERGVLFGLTVSRAAAAVAVGLIGFELALFNEDVLNACILLILVTALWSAASVERAGKKVAILLASNEDASMDSDKILVPVANPKNLTGLIELAAMIEDPAMRSAIYPLLIVPDRADAADRVRSGAQELEAGIKQAAAGKIDMQVITRIDVNIAGGILRAARELGATDIVIGWDARISLKDRLFIRMNIFGTVLDQILRNSEKRIFVYHSLVPLNTIQSLVVAVPPNAEKDADFPHWLRRIAFLSRQSGSSVHFHTVESSAGEIQRQWELLRGAGPVSFLPFNSWAAFANLNGKLGKDDLLVVVSARPGTVGHSTDLDRLPRKLSMHFSESNFIVIYPASRTET